jgi:hypothetical protein
MCLLVAYQIVVIIVVPAQCTPLEKYKGTASMQMLSTMVRLQLNCILHFRYLLMVATSAFHILMDLWILVLPIKLIMSIPRPPREKLAIFIIFGLGIVSTIASVIRLQSLRIFTLSNDPFYDSLPINTWSMVEVNIGIVCASIPSLKPLLSRAQRLRAEHGSRKDGNRMSDLSDWGRESKVPILKTGKDLMISLHPGTVRGGQKTVDEEWELDDRPPPPPPKDEKYGAIRHALVYQQVIRYPDMAYGKI